MLAVLGEHQGSECTGQDLLEFGVGDLGGLPMSFLEQPLEQQAAPQPAASAQDCDADSDEGGQGDPQFLESSMYIMNDSEPGPPLLQMLHNSLICSAPMSPWLPL